MPRYTAWVRRLFQPGPFNGFSVSPWFAVAGGSCRPACVDALTKWLEENPDEKAGEWVVLEGTDGPILESY